MLNALVGKRTGYSNVKHMRMLDLENPHLHSVWLEVKLHNFEIMIDKALDLNQNVIMGT